MEFSTLELTLISAQDLQEVNLMSKMNVYAIVSITNDPQSKQRTPPDRIGGRNPTWNSTFRFTVPAADPGPNLALYVLLRTERALGDRDVGHVTVPLRELLLLANNGGHADSVQFRSYGVYKPHSRRTKGVLHFSYKLGERVAITRKVDEPVLAYPYPYPYPAAAAAEYGYGYYPPPPPQAVYPPPPAAAGYGYGYQQQVVQPAKPKRSNGGFGMGLLGGALGGLLIGDMLSNDVGAYDAGYDAGFDDGGGFDY